MNKYFFSIVIIFQEKNFYLFKLLDSLNNQTYKNFNVVLVSENNFEYVSNKYTYEIKFIHAKTNSPPLKRDLGINQSNCEYVVFIDDDAYPDIYWLEKAKHNISKFGHIVFGGPGLIPDDEKIISKILSLYNYSFFTGGIPKRMLNTGKMEIVLEWPTMNFFCQKKVLDNIGNFNNEFWPGDDTYICNKINKKNIIIYYVPEIFIYHYRRQSIFKHFKQIFRYGLHRAYFFKMGMKNSKKIVYFLPSLMLIMAPILSLFLLLKFPLILLCLLLVYFICASIIIFYKSSSFLSPLSVFFVPFNIFTYGLSFFIGLTSKNLKSKYGR